MSQTLLRPFLILGLIIALPHFGHATPSGLNNIPTADTVPQGTLVLQTFSTVGGDPDPDLNIPRTHFATNALS